MAKKIYEYEVGKEDDEIWLVENAARMFECLKLFLGQERYSYKYYGVSDEHKSGYERAVYDLQKWLDSYNLSHKFTIKPYHEV